MLLAIFLGGSTTFNSREVGLYFSAASFIVLAWTVATLVRVSKKIKVAARELPCLAFIKIPMGKVKEDEATISLRNASPFGIRRSSVRIAPCIFEVGEEDLQVMFRGPFRVVDLGSIEVDFESQKDTIWEDLIACNEFAANLKERFQNGIAGLKVTVFVRGNEANRLSVFTGEYIAKKLPDGFAISCVREDLAGRIL